MKGLAQVQLLGMLIGKCCNMFGSVDNAVFILHLG